MTGQTIIGILLAAFIAIAGAWAFVGQQFDHTALHAVAGAVSHRR